MLVTQAFRFEPDPNRARSRWAGQACGCGPIYLQLGSLPLPAGSRAGRARAVGN